MSSSEIEFHNVSYRYPDSDRNIFTELDIKLNGGFTSLVGQNGTGKSTFLLLAGGRFLPEVGSVKILGKHSSELTDEETRNKLVSFVYQNMEFETEQPVAELFEYVATQGNHKPRSAKILEELVKVFSLEKASAKRMQEMSKGEIQKSVIVFSLLYASPIIMMDEPVFALEQKDKEKVMEYLASYSKIYKTSIYLSIHELDLSRKYTENVLLMHKKGKTAEYGKSKDLLLPEKLEELYEVPAAMLYEKEQLYRNHLREEHALLRKQKNEYLARQQKKQNNHKN